ncbi:variable surface protein [Plasmodium gonderi]|uniref:Variable surface protein n=1 Tax=Plasmodium gonderi TaxID=77519 RepID=A0A1Y1JU73_PLAGO|nr:variable surface protein [Plasmodium gonderi]GAW84292.1 variable surface protein [Plasmodium gonderi]
MPENIIASDDFNYMEIFPTCINEFNRAKSNNTYSWLNDAYNQCTQIKWKLNIEGDSFNRYCTDLIYYLNYINDNLGINKNANCKYFNYLLKYITDKFKVICDGEENCYEEMIKSNISNIPGMPNTCVQYVKNINNDTFEILKKLDKLYESLKLLGTEKYTCPYDSECYDIYKELSKKCTNESNKNFCELLEKFKNIHVNDVDDVDDEGDVGDVDDEDDVDDLDIVDVVKRTHSSSYKHIRAIFLTLTFTIFYTPYGSVLHEVLRKLKKLFMKNNKERLSLLDSCERSYNNSIEHGYRIEYGSEDYV